MRLSTIGRIAAVACALASAGCSGDGTHLTLIGSGDDVRVLDVSAAGCPTGWADAGFDDGAWSSWRLPIASVPTAGLCLRKRFDVSADVSRYRWLTIMLSSHSRAQLNVGRPITRAQEQGGIDWTTDDDPTIAASVQKQYRLDLRLFPDLLHAQDNVLALVVSASPQPVDVSAELDVDTSADQGLVQVVKGPYLVLPSNAGARIEWETSRSAPSWAIVDGARNDGGWAVHHDVAVSHVGAATVHPFYVESAEANALPTDCTGVPIGRTPNPSQVSDSPEDFWRYIERREQCSQLTAAIRSPPQTLRGAPAATGKLRFVVVGGTRADAALGGSVLTEASLEAADLVVHTGDLVAESVEPDWQALFDRSRALLAYAPIVPAAGERDLTMLGHDRFGLLFAVDATRAIGRAYSVDRGPAHLAILDGNADLGAQADWLDGDLAAAETAGALHSFVVLHQGPWSAGPTGGSADALATIVPVLARHRVRALLSGHDRIYEHGIAGGLHYFVSGGAGDAAEPVTATGTTVTALAVPHYLVVELDGAAAQVTAKGADGKTLDSVALAP